ncbi:MAG: DNA repair protein RecN [Clostridiales bacterium]|nr:DNA repair protein RecN [Clostridiales bacterium]
MLSELTVRNIALINQLTISFFSGFHALTGETGAGKSILIDSISLLLGGKSSKEMIRTGEKRAFVEGIFNLNDSPEALSFLEQQDTVCENNELILSREITDSGRSICRVNGLVWQLNLYQQLTSLLMDLHGQHAHQSLMNDKTHLGYLDSFGGKDHIELVYTVKQRYSEWHSKHLESERLRKLSLEKSEKMEFLMYQKKELDSAHLVRNEEEELTHERDMFRNAEKITSRIDSAYDQVYSSSPSAMHLVKSASAEILDISGLDPRFSELASRLTDAYYDLEDIGLTLRDIRNELPSDEDRLEEIEVRLDLIRRLSRKYGATTGDMLDKLDVINSLLNDFDDMDTLLYECEKAEEKSRSAYDDAAAVLTASRKKLAGHFEKEMEKQLADLNMSGTRFYVNLVSCDASSAGNETASFMISPNRGESMQPLSKTASGGELSRIMLAIKTVGMQSTGVPSMIFDEIDTGISGVTAQKVAEKMRALSVNKQILCVTHLQQIASMAQHQYLVEKAFDGSRTSTSISLLDEQGRISEIARMLGGDYESAKVHAADMLKMNVSDHQ